MADDLKLDAINVAVAGQFIDAFERGTSPFLAKRGMGELPPLPLDMDKKRPYSGINALWLIQHAHSAGIAHEPRYATVAQVERAGGRVLEGVAATVCQHWGYHKREPLRDGYGNLFRDDQGRVVERQTPLDRPKISSYWVVNLAQTEGLPPYVPKERSDEERLDAAEKLVRHSGAAIFHDAKTVSYYDAAGDAIHLRDKTTYDGRAEYLADAIGQLAAWTGHHTRLDRPGVQAPMGSREQARESMRAMFCSYLVCAELGIAYNGAQTAQAAKWAGILKSDPGELLRAANDADLSRKLLFDLARENGKTTAEYFADNLHRKGSATDRRRTIYELVEPGAVADVSGHAVRVRPWNAKAGRHESGTVHHGPADAPWTRDQAERFCHHTAEIYINSELAAKIDRRKFDDPERNDLQERIITTIADDPEPFFARYAKLPQSRGGRFINSDVMKMTIPEYAESSEAREKFNLAAHNSCAVLAEAQLKRVLQEEKQSGREHVVLLTGAPGVGKTTTVLNAPWIDKVHAVYEGQLANPKTAFDKIDDVLDAGFTPVIAVIHGKPERSLDNAIERYEKMGRVATLDLIASIQGRLNDSLKQVHEKYGDKVKLAIYDKREYDKTVLHKGWEHLDLLQSEGTYEQIKEKLIAHIDERKDEISEKAYRLFRPGISLTVTPKEEKEGEHDRNTQDREAVAGAPGDGGTRGTGLADSDGASGRSEGQHQADGQRSGVPEENRGSNCLKVGTWLSVHESQEGRAIFAGARYHEEAKRWFAPKGTDALAVADWIPVRNDRKQFIEDLDLEHEALDSERIKWTLHEGGDGRFTVLVRNTRNKKLDHPLFGRKFDDPDIAKALIFNEATLAEPKFALSTQAHLVSELNDPRAPVGFDAAGTLYRVCPPGRNEGKFGHTLVTIDREGNKTIYGDDRMPGWSRTEAVKAALGMAVLPDREQGVEDVTLVEKPPVLKAERATPLTLPYDDRAVAEQIGAVWDHQEKTWFIPEGGDLLDAAHRLAGSEIRDQFIGGIRDATGFQPVVDRAETSFCILRPDVHPNYKGYVVKTSTPVRNDTGDLCFAVKCHGKEEEPGYTFEEAVELAAGMADLGDGLKTKFKEALTHDLRVADAAGRMFEWQYQPAPGASAKFQGAFVNMHDGNGRNEQIGSEDWVWFEEQAQDTALMMAELPFEHGVNIQPIIVHELAKFKKTVDSDGNVYKIVEDDNDLCHLEVKNRQGEITRYGDKEGERYSMREAVLGGARLCLEHCRNAPMPAPPVADKFMKDMEQRGTGIDADDKFYHVMDAVMYREQGYKGYVLEVSYLNKDHKVYGSKEGAGWDEQTCKDRAIALANLKERNIIAQKVLMPEQEFAEKLSKAGFAIGEAPILDGTRQIVTETTNGESKKIGEYIGLVQDSGKATCEYTNYKVGIRGILRYTAHTLTPEYKEELRNEQPQLPKQLPLLEHAKGKEEENKQVLSAKEKVQLER